MPHYLNEVFMKAPESSSSLRNSYQKLQQPFRKTNTGQNALSFIGLALWNKVPEKIFSSQCTTISNNSVSPSCKHFITDKRLTMTKFNKDDILKIRNLNVNKAHGHNNISIRMLKICDSVVTEPLSIVFKSCDCGIFPEIWKMSHIIPTHKKMLNII